MNRGQPLAVVTRPEPDCAGTTESLRQRGLDAIASPPFRLVARPAGELAGALSRLEGMDYVVVVSPFAARLVAAHASPAMLDKPVFIAPGSGTGRILEDAGAEVTWPESGGTSEAILELPQLSAVEGRSVGIFGAPGGRRLIDQELARRGAEIQRVDGYLREPLAPAEALLDALARGRRLTVLVSSMNALEQISDGLPDALRAHWFDSAFIVSSPRLEQACRRRGAHDVTVAAGASDGAMLDALERVR
ncbi:MAG: uroporphyrinogen-III synthase [Candidatus Wenzhouxiangella sp. M2_3B_020]